MKQNVNFVSFLVLSLAFLSPARAAPPHFPEDCLAPAVEIVTEQDRHAVQAALQLIQKGEHSLALAQLSPLTESNPRHSTLRILSAYVVLQVGNVLGAFDKDENAKVEETQDQPCLPARLAF